ncbi:MAG: sugar phosphate nucleotidyltransferase [Patescibacteria group bacterium]
MKILLVVGGYGTRFWPASRRKNPKQHQKVVHNRKTLVQLKLQYLLLGFKPTDIFVITGGRYEKELRRQLSVIPKRNFIFEPMMKDTAPAVGLGLIKIAAAFPDEVVSIQWSDHLIRKPKAFIKALKAGEELAKESGRDLIVGVRPASPSVHKGYIKAGRKIRELDPGYGVELHQFIKFVEKPDLNTARKYLLSGDYFWNTGYFIVHTSRVLEKYSKSVPEMYKGLSKIMKSIGTPTEAETTRKVYAGLDKQAFDYAYAERLKPTEAFLLCADMDWHDVGEWNSLKEALGKEPEGNVVKGMARDLECQNCLIFNYEKNKLVTGIDLKDMVVVNTPDALLVCPQDSVAKIKKLLKTFEGTRLEKFI